MCFHVSVPKITLFGTESVFSITCTTCHARLKVRDESTMGSILPCPKCGSFVEIVRTDAKPSGETPGQEAQPLQAPPPVAAPATDDEKTLKAAAITAAAVVPPPVAETLADKQPVPPADTAGGMPSWTSPTELMWRKWLILIGSPVAGLVLMVALMSVFFPTDATTPGQKTSPATDAALTRDETVSHETASDQSHDNAKTVRNYLKTGVLPYETRVVLSLTPAELAGQSGVQRLLSAAGPLWTAAMAPAIEGLGLDLGQIARVTLCATDARAMSEDVAAATRSVIVIELEPHVDLDALAEKGQIDSAAWGHPFEVWPRTRTIVTGPAELIREIATRSATNLASRPLSRLLESINTEANLIVLADVSATAAQRYVQRAKMLLDIWRDGRQAWQTICELPTGVGVTLRWPAGIEAHVALVCADKTDAQRLDAALATLIPAARTALAARIKRLGQEVGWGQVQPLWADRYETFLKHALSAIRPLRRDVVDDVLWLRSGWDNDPVSTALTSLDAVGPVKTDWLAAAGDCDRGNQQKILSGLDDYRRAEGSYPAGAVGGALLPPQTRLSWLASLLPYQERRDWHRRLQFGYPWNSEQNTPVTTRPLATVVNPALGASKTDDGFPVTHYVGVAGLGKDAGGLSRSDPKAGVFGFGRTVRRQDIADGASNTIAVLGVCDDLGPWSAGGHATVRGLSERPYINGPDGFGSGQPQGMLAGMADGSTRFISKDIDPRVLEQMVTTHGGDGSAASTVAAAKRPAAMSSAVKARLQARIARIEFSDIPLAEVIGFVEEFTALRIAFDAPAMERLGISPGAPVTVDLSAASVAEILAAVLAPRGLECVEREGRLLITGQR